jgi:hypothetical protein
MRVDTFRMRKKTTPPTRPETHREKQVMDKPQEEFVANQSIPSQDVSEQSISPQKPQPAHPD